MIALIRFKWLRACWMLYYDIFHSMHHVDEQSIELDSIIEIQKNILGSDVDSSCIAGLSANIWNYIILNLCYQALLPALTCSSEAISKSALIDMWNTFNALFGWFFFGGAVSTTILGCSTTILGRSTAILGRSTVCPWFFHGHVFRTKKRTIKTHTDFCWSPHHHFAGKFQQWRPVKKLSKCNYGELNWVYIASIWYAIALANCWRNVGLFMWMFKAIS